MKKKGGKNNKSFQETIIGYIFILPGFLGFILFVLFPVVFSLILSFTEWNFIGGFDSIQFVGLKNYLKLSKDEWFTSSFVNTIIFTLGTIPVTTFLGLIVASLLNDLAYFKNFLRITLFIPYISSVIAVSVVWMVILHPSYGPVNEFLRMIGVSDPPKWLADLDWALPSIMLIYIWKQIGYYVVVYMAGLKGISESLYEAAKIDGAGYWQRFRYITIPMASPTTFFLATMGIINSFKVFDYISVLTEGGPGTSTTVLAYYIYKSAFGYYKMGYASSISWVLFILIFAVTMYQWRAQNKWVTYD